MKNTELIIKIDGLKKEQDLMQNQIKELKKHLLDNLIDESGLKKHDVLTKVKGSKNYKDLLVVSGFDIVLNPKIDFDAMLSDDESHILEVRFTEVTRLMNLKVHSKDIRTTRYTHNKFEKVGKYITCAFKVELT